MKVPHALGLSSRRLCCHGGTWLGPPLPNTRQIPRYIGGNRCGVVLCDGPKQALAQRARKPAPPPRTTRPGPGLPTGAAVVAGGAAAARTGDDPPNTPPGASGCKGRREKPIATYAANKSRMHANKSRMQPISSAWTISSSNKSLAAAVA
jgi:hypothetical protein